MLDLVMLLTLLHQLDSLITRQDERLEGKIFLGDLLHLFLDVGQILIAELGVAQINIVEEAVLGRGTKGKVRLRVEALDGLGHDGLPCGAECAVLSSCGHSATVPSL